jgi:mannonate dehydratase
MLGVLHGLWSAEQENADLNIPLRPDHGHLLEFEQDGKSNPGYSYIGRLKGLAELRGAWAAFGAMSK